jgi:hypothetical protein
MTNRDPVSRLIAGAKSRYVIAARAVTALQVQFAQIAPEEGAKRERLRSTLAQRIIERDTALQAFEELQSQPRWKLEKLANAGKEYSADFSI